MTDPFDPLYPEQLIIYQQWLNGFYELTNAQSKLFKFIPIKFHIVAKTVVPGSPLEYCTVPPTEEELTGLIADLNSAFLNIRMSFYQLGGVDYSIQDDNLHTLRCQQDIDSLLLTNNELHAIDIYFVNYMENDDACVINGTLQGVLAGLSTWTASPLQGIILRNCGGEAEPSGRCWTIGPPCDYHEVCPAPVCCRDPCAPYRNKTFIHEVGHYFDLLHPNTAAFGVECPNGTPDHRASCGGFLADTPAEPGSYVVNECIPGFGPPNPPCHPGSLYVSDITNYMNAHVDAKPCRNHFTMGQLIRARACLLNLRNTELP